MKKFIYVLFYLASCILLLTSCGKTVANEKKIEKDLSAYSGFLEDEEKVESVKIDKRQTDKDEKIDTVWCDVVTEDQECSYQKGIILTYSLYNDKGWILDDVSVDSTKERVITPLTGIKEDNIPATLKNKNITINEESWAIIPKDISIIKHDTNLKDQTDSVIAQITIEDAVQEATGQLMITYTFDDAWKIDSISGEDSFEISSIPGKEPDITEEKLIETLSGEEYKYGIPENTPIYLISNLQVITINKSEISNFRIESSEITGKGTLQKYNISCKLTKPNAEFATNATITYSYSNADGWKLHVNNVKLTCTSVSIQGDWKGTYVNVTEEGQAVLTIQDISDDGTITGTYSYTPDVTKSYNAHAGSYYVSGKIDFTTLYMKLEAGDWINAPAKPKPFEKARITARLYIENSIVSGLGHNNSSFELSQ